MLHFFYKDFTSMELWLQDIARRYASSVTLKKIGTSVERRPIYVVTINDKFVNKPIILLEGGAHPREWISASSILYLIEKIASFTGFLNAHFMTLHFKQYARKNK